MTIAARTLDLSELTRAQGFVAQGDVVSDKVGYSVSSAGDVNGDGVDDLIIGAPFDFGDGRTICLTDLGTTAGLADDVPIAWTLLCPSPTGRPCHDHSYPCSRPVAADPGAGLHHYG